MVGIDHPLCCLHGPGIVNEVFHQKERELRGFGPGTRKNATPAQFSFECFKDAVQCQLIVTLPP